MGKRDYAIILLSARNGLRDSNIIHLKLTDVGRILRTFKIKKNVEVTDHGKDDF
ncbi:hypothetical protein AALC75_19005 [Lachnospiraceae bacterium 48-42]